MKNKTNLKDPKMQKLSILKGPVYSLPILYYINELTIPGDIRSCHTTSVNRYALEFICRSRSQLKGMGINNFREIVHPEDLMFLKLSLKTTYPVGSVMTFTTTMRLKPYGQTNYRLFTCSKIVLETFSDGTVKNILVAATDITNIPLAGQLTVPTPDELVQLKNGRIYATITDREREVLRLIVNGMKSKEMAIRLLISIETVKKHRSSLIQKTYVKSVAALIAMAVRSWGY